MNEFQAAYEISQLTTDLQPDYQVIAALRDSGYFVVAAKSPAYCRFTDAVLPSPYVCVARDDERQPLCFQSEQAARTWMTAAWERDAEGGMDDITYDILPPTMERNHWRAAVANFVSEHLDLDPEDARKTCWRLRDAFDATHAVGTAPAVAAAEALRGSEWFDYEAWRARHMPEIECPVPADEPCDPLTDNCPF